MVTLYEIELKSCGICGFHTDDAHSTLALPECVNLAITSPGTESEKASLLWELGRRVAVGVGVSVGVSVLVGVSVGVGVFVGVLVGVSVGVLVGVEVGRVQLSSATLDLIS